MLDDGDQFYVEPEVEQVRPVYELEIPNVYEKPVVAYQNQSTPLKIVQKPKELKYQYKRFKFDRQPSQQSEQQNSQLPQQVSTGLFTFYSQQQLIYKKYHNESLSHYKTTAFFSGTFFHHNVFSSAQKTDSNNITDLIKDFYEVHPEKKLPQDDLASSSTLIFDSQFQSGNLFAAFKLSDCEYDLVMEMDKNSAGNTQWFFFSVMNMNPSKQYTFNIINFTKNDSLFNYGMEPAVYSVIQAQRAKNTQEVWKRMGLQVSYKKGSLPRQGRSKKLYYKLSFKLISRHSGDKLFIAHSFPYSYAKLNQFILQKTQNHKDIVEKLTIGKTLTNRAIECLKITTQTKKKDTRKAIIVLARQHPGQTQGSFVCEGVVERLLEKSKQSEMLRKNYIFYVVPMVNIDGVVFGHYRTNLAGKDLNRKWDSSEKQTICPEVTSIKSFISQLSKQRPIRFVLDLHGHSKKLNSFFYGNPCPQNPEVVRIYPFLCSKLTQAIEFQDCTFTSEEYKRKAARIYLSYLYKLVHVYTFEVSFYAYIKDGKKKQFTPRQYRQLGGKLVEGLAFQLQHQVKYQQSFQFNVSKNSQNKLFMQSPFVKYLIQLKQNKALLQVGEASTSGSQSKPQEGEINDQQIQEVKKIEKQKLKRQFSMALKEEMRSVKISRKGQRQVREMNNKRTRNVRLLQMNKINSVLPDKFQLCLQPIRKEPKTLNQTLKTSVSALLKQNSQCQTQKNSCQQIYKQLKRTQIQSTANLSNSVKINYKGQKPYEKRYSSVIKTQNRNNIIFKIDYLGANQQSTFRNKANLQLRSHNPSKLFQIKHAFSQTILTFPTQGNDKLKHKKDSSSSNYNNFSSNYNNNHNNSSSNHNNQDKFKNSHLYLPSVDTPQERVWTRNNSIKYDTVRIGNKREAELYLNGVVKKYLVEKQQLRQQPLSIFAKVLERPKSMKRK